jgi:hypothetical protein
MSIKINSIQRLSAMSTDPINRYRRTNPDVPRRNPLSGLFFQGTVAGYASSGIKSPPTPTLSNVIDKFPFATNANATDVGDLSVERHFQAGQSSDVSGYNSGGFTPPATFNNVIDKFPFAADANATDVGDLTLARRTAAGQSSAVSGYTSGGLSGFSPPSPAPAVYSNVIDKFPFATNANATDVGDLSLARVQVAGQSSDVNGYTSGGARVPQVSPAIPLFLSSTVDRFPFATNANATEVTALTILVQGRAGHSSDVSGYTSGGYGRSFPGVPTVTYPATNRIRIEKFPFATDATEGTNSEVGDLTVARSYAAGQSSIASGYTSGGSTSVYYNIIDKFPFASNANATDVGDLTVARERPAGHQD